MPACPLLSACGFICGCSDPLWLLTILAKVRGDSKEQSAWHNSLSLKHQLNSQLEHAVGVSQHPIHLTGSLLFQAKASKLHTTVNEVMKHMVVLWKYNEEMTLTIGLSLYITLGAQIPLLTLQITFSLGIMGPLCVLSLCNASLFQPTYGHC